MSVHRVKSTFDSVGHQNVPRQEAQELVVCGHGESGGVAEERIARAVYDGGKHVLEAQELSRGGNRIRNAWRDIN